MFFGKFKNFTFFFLIILASFIFGANLINKAEAFCKVDCTLITTSSSSGAPTNCEYYPMFDLLDSHMACVVGNVPETPSSLFSTGPSCVNSDINATPAPNTKACQTSACPSFNNMNGSQCKIVSGAGAICTTGSTATGVWDANQSKCIQCSGKIENKVCGNSGTLDLSCSLSADNAFDTACDNSVSVQCDEQVAGCVGSAGFCDANGVWTVCPLSNCSAGACPAATATPTVTSTPTATPTGVSCPPLAPGDSCANPGAKAENRYDPIAGSCKPFPVPCPLAYFCENGVCKEPRSLFAMLFDGVSFLLSLVISLAILIILIGGFRYTLSGGDNSNIESAKKILYYGLLGLIVAGLSYAIVRTIYNLLY